ncbi:MAG: GNAT family N-acetyltransferase [Candidatus Heimdallarchaeota archaeon]|nr:GNAT family N-acetyltransferase [Candidatus Heimdallarchaeota archaeon]
MDYSVSHYNNISEISKEVDKYLNQHSIINFEAIGILEKLRENSKEFEGVLECIVVSEAEKIQVVSCRIRPYNLLISNSQDIHAISALVQYFSQSRITIPGIYGPMAEVEHFTNLWKEISDEVFQTSDEFLQYSLSKKTLSTQLIGDISIAKIEYTELLKGWTEASIREIIPSSTVEFVKSCTQSFLRLLEKNKVFILKVDNSLVSMAAISGQTKTMQAINDVYTPPEYRGKGYATELCIFLCEYILNDCDNIPILWVKATNLTAIHIYEKIGFEKVAEMELSLKKLVAGT